VVIVGDRIAALGPRGSVPVPADATVRDVTGKIIIPGLIDAHAHSSRSRARSTMARIFPAARLWRHLGAGSAAVHADIFAYADHGRRTVHRPAPVQHRSRRLRQQRDHLAGRGARRAHRYRDAYRTRNIKSYMVGDRAARQAAMAGAACGMMPTEGAADYVLELTHAIDGFSGNEHNLPITPIHDDVIRLFVASQIAYTPTITVLYGGPPLLFDAVENRAPQADARWRASPPFVLAAKLRDRHWTAAPWQTWPRFAADAMRLRRAGGLSASAAMGKCRAWACTGKWPRSWPAAPPRKRRWKWQRSTTPASSAGPMTWAASRRASWPIWSCSMPIRAPTSPMRAVALVLRGGIAFDGKTLARDGNAACAVVARGAAMKPATLRAWSKVHTWSSLICTLFLLMLALTGLPLVFHDEIDRLTHPARGGELDGSRTAADRPGDRRHARAAARPSADLPQLRRGSAGDQPYHRPRQ
jgi:hypothetical protein